MTQTDERELVLGNKQLLSAFFVVVILLGVFFTMGYFVGRNTATGGFNSGPSAATGGQRADPAGKPLDSGSATPSTAPPDSTVPASEPPPAAETSAPATPNPTPAATEAAPKEAAKEALVQPGSEQMYLQVSAVRRPDAENLVKLLRERGFPALLGESSKQGLYRVLVGPFKTTSELGHTKADLKAKGFDSIVAK